MDENDLKEADESVENPVEETSEAPPQKEVKSQEKAPVEKDYKKLSLRETINDARDQAEKREPNQKQRSSKEASIEKALREKLASKSEERDSGQTSEKESAQLVEPKKSSYKPPTSWAKEAKGVWDSLPETVHKAIEKRESEFAKGKKEYDDKLNGFKELDEILKPWDGILQQNRLSRGGLVKQLLDWQNNLYNPSTKVEAFKRLAQTVGLDLAQLVEESPKQQQQQQQPAKKQTIDQDWVRQEFDRLQAERTEQDNLTKLKKWSEGKPHYERLKNHIAAVLQSGSVPEGDMMEMLDKAYDKAIKLDDELYAQLESERKEKEAEEAKALAAKKERERLAKLEKARTAGSGIKPSAPTANVATLANSKKGDVSVRQSLMEAMKEINDG